MEQLRILLLSLSIQMILHVRVSSWLLLHYRLKDLVKISLNCIAVSMIDPFIRILIHLGRAHLVKIMLDRIAFTKVNSPV